RRHGFPGGLGGRAGDAAWLVLPANRQRIVELFPTAHRGDLRLLVRQGIVEIDGGTSTPPRGYAPLLFTDLAYNVPRGQPPAAAPRRTACTTNSRRVNAPSVSASLAGLSSTSAWPSAGARPGSTSGGT